MEAAASAVEAATARLSRVKGVESRVLEGDYLHLTPLPDDEPSFWDRPALPDALDKPFDVVIANPPYVRTQVLGARESQRLSVRFGLTGRVDLYHAFLISVTEALRPSGVLGIITSNRFLMTLSGAAVRAYLLRHYVIHEVIDLGDTKLFEAAVLPAIFIGRRRGERSVYTVSPPARFTRVYSTSGPNDDAPRRASIFEVLREGIPGSYRLPQGLFQLAGGDLVLERDPAHVWSLTTHDETEWVRRLRATAAGCFGDLAVVRVGLKTTADEVFVRTDWHTLPHETRPEAALLRPLLRHADARRWVLPTQTNPRARVLYPHEVVQGYRRPVDLLRYPCARAYLEAHRPRLERRDYVLRAGRQWYEIWVPQDPEAWAEPKIVFPDISPDPRFFFDSHGRLVDGNCYWCTLRPGVPQDTLYLLLGVANSTLMSRFHDLAFNNRLYSARRRYMTQYVARYPYPSPTAPASRRLVSLVKRVVQECCLPGSTEPGSDVETELDSLVQEAFGFPRSVCP